MDYHITITPYDPTCGVQLVWEAGFMITVQAHEGEVVIHANQSGLIALARHCLTLAQAAVPPGAHVHLDSGTGLEDGSIPLILAKLADDEPSDK